MGKREITTQMARAAGITAKQAQKAYASLLAEIKTALKKEQKVNLSGFGTFEIRVREAHPGRNPKTGAFIPVPKKKRVKFCISRMFKNAL
jgi:DNA-binding protein HU-beta